jgi:hypothetical protein
MHFGGARLARRASTIAAASLLAGFMPLARASTDQWIGGNSDWNTPANWSAAAVPITGQTVDVTASNGASFSVAYDGSSSTALGPVKIDLTGGNSSASATLNLNSTFTLSSINQTVGVTGVGIVDQSAGTNTIGTTLFVGDNSAVAGTYIQSGGALSASAENIGAPASGQANFNQTGGNNLMTNLFLGDGATGTYSLANTGSLSARAEYVGDNGAGFFNQSGGTNTMPSGAGLYLGYFTSTAAGTYLLSQNATLSAPAEYIGASGAGTFNQSGGTNTVATSLYIGENATGNGTYKLSAGGVSAQVEYIGFTGSGAINQSGGTNAVSGSVYLGFNQNGTGAYVLSGSGSVSASSELVGVAGGGNCVFTQSGGMNSAGDLEIAQTGTGTFDLAGGSLTATTENIGSFADGTFNQTGGSNVVTGSFTLAAGNTTQRVGTASYVLANGSLSANTEFVGNSGMGAFNQSGGSNTVANSLFIAYSNGSTGAYTLNSGALTVNGSAYLGGSSTAPGGKAVLTIGTAGRPSVVGTLQVWQSGQIQLNGICTVGNISIASGGLINVDGALLIDYGSGASPETTVRKYIEAGAITSTYAASNGLGIGYADGNDAGVEGLLAGQIVVEPALAGDTDLNGTVNIHDLLNLLVNFNQPGFWDQGNFNGHATVDISDMQALLNNFNQAASLTYSELNGLENLVAQFGDTAIPNTDGTGFTLVAVPEPASAGLLAIGAGLLVRRRRSRTPNC